VSYDPKTGHFLAKSRFFSVLAKLLLMEIVSYGSEVTNRCVWLAMVILCIRLRYNIC